MDIAEQLVEPFRLWKLNGLVIHVTIAAPSESGFTFLYRSFFTMHSIRFLFCGLFTLCLLHSIPESGRPNCIADDDDFPKLYNSERAKNAKPLSPKLAAAGFKVPDGFKVNVFAAEPDVLNPIAMNWDAKGRLWIAENFTYAERPQKFDLSLRDRVICLEDSDHDGVADKRTVFTDQVQMLTGIEVGRGGVWLMCPPKLLFIPDADGDAIPDGPPQVVLEGFDVAKENYHNFANGLKWGPDGWLYGRCGGSCPGKVGRPGTPPKSRIALEGGIWRVHPKNGRFEAIAHGTTNPWGHDWNEMGEGFFINTVNGHLWHLIPGAHYHRPFTLDPNPNVYELLEMHADHWHFDTGQSWTKSRDGAANSFGGGHAHSGMMIYQGNQWPEEYYGKLFTWNLHGRRANQEILERQGSGYVGKHGKDVFLSRDPFFRGLDLSTGPDGTVYVIDWSDTGECHENSGVHRTSGRVFRISHNDGKRRRKILGDLTRLTGVQLADLMKHRNEWYVRQARVLLAERMHTASKKPQPTDTSMQSAVDKLRQLSKSPDNRIALRAVFTLHAMNQLDETTVKLLLTHSNEHLRVLAIRHLTDQWPLDDVFGPTHQAKSESERVTQQAREWIDRFCEMAAKDTNGLVRLTLTSTLQRLPVALRPRLASRLVERQEDADDHNLPLMIWYGLMPVAESHPQELARVACLSRIPKTQRLIARRLAEDFDNQLKSIEILLEFLIRSKDDNVRRNLLSGIQDGLKGWSKAREPSNWESLVDSINRRDHAENKTIARELSVLFGDGRALGEVRKIVMDQTADIGIRRSALKTMIATNGKGIVDICLQLLGDARINVDAAQGLKRSDDPRVAPALVANYRRFRSPQRPRIIAILVSRPLFAKTLLKAISQNQIPVNDLTPFDVRQIRSMNQQELNQLVSEVWGNIRESSKEKLAQIEKLKSGLKLENLKKANLHEGKKLFQKSCSKCHRLFGMGDTIGPDLTGANRNNMDYLLENIVTPSAVVSKNYRMTVIETVDGRTLNGLLVSQNKKTLTLQTQTDRLVINLENVENRKKTPYSPMPDGLLDNLSSQQIRDLIGYLQLPSALRPSGK